MSREDTGEEKNQENSVGLKKALLSRHVAMISIGGIIGSGLFVGSSAAIASAGPAILVSYVIAGVIVFLLMRMLGEMAISSGEAGSFTEYIRLGLGDYAGFLSGWMYWYFWVVALAVESIAGAVIIAEWIPLPEWQIGLALLAMLTGINLMSTRSFGEFEFWFSLLKVMAIVVFIGIVGAYGFGLGQEATGFSNLYSHGGFAPNGLVAVLAGVTTVVFALVGAEIVTVAAAETSEPDKAIANLTTTLIFRITLFFMASLFVILLVVPWNRVVPGETPFALALDIVGVPGAANIMKAVVLVAVLSCLNSGIYVASRILFVLAAKSDAPQWLVKVDSRGVPSRAILMASFFSCFGVLASIFSTSEVFTFLVNASGGIMLIVYLLMAVAQVSLRRRSEATGQVITSVRMWLFPWLSYAVIASICAVLVSMLFAPGLFEQLLGSFVCVAVISLLFLFMRRAKA